VRTLGITHSVCENCGQIMPAKIISDGSDVFFKKLCVVHGESTSLIYNNLEKYLQTQRYVKPAWIPKKFSGQSNKPCPEGCGFCDRHEQHLCMPIVEITSRCNLACPICIADAGRKWDITLEQFNELVANLIIAESQIDVFNISGGEPLMHPKILEIIDNALNHQEIVRVSISTNGLVLLDKPSLVQQLKERNVVISLQFDGFDDKVYEILRGSKLLKQKLEILDLLKKSQISTSLTVTAANEINTSQFPAIAEYFFTNSHIISMMIQPLSFAGRGVNLSGKIKRLTIYDVTRLLGEMGEKRIKTPDFAPLPCSHPSCFYLAFYLMLNDGNSISLNQLVDATKMMDLLANKTVFGLDSEEQDSLKDLVYEIWSGPAGSVPDSEEVMKTLRRILNQMSSSCSCSCFDPRKAFTIAERNIKSIFIHAFQDAENFDLSRVRRCCQAYPQIDGKIIPACVHNVLGRNNNGISGRKRK
jgi:uncharacterized radical SAM superfamily Fe-S cluster-containing enzyme